MGEKMHVDTAALGLVGFQTGMKGSKEMLALPTSFADVAGDVVGSATNIALALANERRAGATRRLSSEIASFGTALAAAASAVDNSDDAAARSIASVRAK